MTDRGRRKITYYFFLFQLALADLVTSLYFFVRVFGGIVEEYWYFGWFSCLYLLPIPEYVAPYASCWILCGISYERYRAITQPFKSRTSKKIISLCCLIIWGSCYAIMIPNVLAKSYTLKVVIHQLLLLWFAKTNFRKYTAQRSCLRTRYF